MKMLIGLAVVCFLAGSLFAISGASTASISQLRWTSAVAATAAPTQGGNITTLSISSAQLTSKWASFNGNVSGTIRLSDTQSGSAVYVWSYSPTNGGEVCTSTGSSFPAGAPTNSSDFANLDTAFGTTGGPDNASGTFNTTCPALTISTGALTGFTAAAAQGSSTFTTCAMNASGTAAANHAFCTSIAATGVGKNYNNSNANFELIVPSTGTAGGSYYFYMELD
ncbi:MAG: hypothetical protein WC861_05185 [Candidatus Micrarchaeia archaeon]|jgi:hypothetical protein